MKKRIICALLTLIMLVSLVPATALTASAAGMSVSENAITVLKQWNGYHSSCKANGYIGYGTPCTVKAEHGKGTHTINEKQADTALRAALKDLNQAVNSFAAGAGLSLTQGQFDALVLFSFDNGTAWTTGTGSFRSAVVNRLKGSDFLNAICNWNSGDNDNRRLVEANMYLNGVYSSSRPSSFIWVDYDAESRTYGSDTVYGSLNGASSRQYYDVSTRPAPHLVPTMKNHTFTGWYVEDASGMGRTKVNTLSAAHHNTTLYADWVLTYSIAGQSSSSLLVDKSELLSTKLYKEPNGDTSSQKLSQFYSYNTSVRIDSEYLDEKGVKWGRIAGTAYWVKLGKMGAEKTNSLTDIDVTVTVTNSYLRSRTEDSIFSTQNGTYNQGAQLRIINTSSNDGFLWGQVAKSNTDNTPIGWVALMYTNFEEVRGQQNVNNAVAVATATVVNVDYVNLRSEAGTHAQIVGALSRGTVVDLYETKYVNGSEWGRCNTGWFCLSYASVKKLVKDESYKTDVNYLSYVFYGVITNPLALKIYQVPGIETLDNEVHTKQIADDSVTVTKLARIGDITWGQIKEGWVKVSDANGNPLDISLAPTKYYVTAESLTVRKSASHSASRVDALVKGVEFDVNKSGSQIIVAGDSVWGQAFKVGEDHRLYDGWVNLASSGVSRTTLPTVEKDEASVTSTKKGTIINTDNVNVREYNDASYKKIGSLSRGTTVAVWEEEDGWYKIDSNKNGVYDYDGDGWVSGKYLDVFTDEESTSGTTTGGTASGSTSSGGVETGLGIVANTYTGVNVRTGAGTAYPINGKILAGTTVEILEVKPVGASKWGRVTQGWICMDYVTMVSYYPIEGAASGNAGTTGSTGSTTTATEQVIFTGKISVDTKIYTETVSDPINADAVRNVSAGTPVTVHELLTVEEEGNPVTNPDGSVSVTTYTRYWARTNDGYILDPGSYITLDPLAEKTYTVTSYVSTVDNELKVYVDPTAGMNSGNETGSTLNKYDTVSVTTLEIVGSNLWCRVEYTDDIGNHHDGFVMMKYLTNGVVSDPSTSNNNSNTNNNTNTNTNTNTGNSGSTGNSGDLVLGSTGNTANQGTNGYVTNSAGYRYTGNVIRTGSVNVRATPSQTAALTTTLKQGAALVIYETCVNEGMAWGRCDAGWVYLYYVDLQPCNTAVDAKVVYNENTIAYTDANCTAVAGTYSRMSVVDIYEVVGNMCRCDLGWVHADNLG